MTFEELLDKIAYDYKHPDQMPDGSVIADKNGNRRMSELQEKYKLSALKVQKLLVTAGVYEPVKRDANYALVQKLYKEGKNMAEIMETTGLSKATVNGFLPYERAAKDLDKLGVDISNDAERKRKQRMNEEMVKENSRNILSDYPSDDVLWETLKLHDRETFVTADGDRFHINALYMVQGRGDGSPERGDVLIISTGNAVIKITKDEVMEAYHKVLVEECIGDYDEYLNPVFTYLGVIDGDRSKATTKRNVSEPKVCACCGRIGVPLYTVSSFDDLIRLEDEFREIERAGWPEEQKRRAETMEKMMEPQRKKYEQQVEDAKSSKVVQSFNDEGERQFCQLCTQTLYHALTEGDVPYVGTKVSCRNLPLVSAKKFYKDQLISTDESWADKNDTVYQKEDIYKAVDTEGTEHFFALSYRRMGVLIGFDAWEVHRLTKAGKRAVNNTDTDYEYHHLIELVGDEDEEQRVYVGMIELIDEIIAGLKSPTLEHGRLGTTGTIIPVYIDNDEYGFLIDGKVYSGAEFAHMASGIEGWQIQFQVKDPSENVLRASEYLMPVRLGKKELVDDTLELLRLFTKDGKFLSDHDEDNFDYLFKDVLKKLKLYHESNPRGFGKLAGMAMIKALEMYEGTELSQERVREVIR